jgi:thiol:disulfide interchange protein DsbC
MGPLAGFVLIGVTCFVGMMSLVGPARAAAPNEALIRKNVAERLPRFPNIEAVNATPFAGLYELRAGADIYYADANGDFVLQGQLIDTKARVNLTEQRLVELNTIDFNSLPYKDALQAKQGNGQRKIAVFSDPNCPYCKRFERELSQLKDTTVYTFLMPILGPDSVEKSRNIWCANDATLAWHDWMLKGSSAPQAKANCDVGALQRNVALGQRLRITGTPGIVFADGRTQSGAINFAELEAAMARAKAAKI